jgi:uncharacterized membrane protein
MRSVNSISGDVLNQGLGLVEICLVLLNSIVFLQNKAMRKGSVLSVFAFTTVVALLKTLFVLLNSIVFLPNKATR